MSWLPCEGVVQGIHLQLVDQALGHPALHVHALRDVEEQPLTRHPRRDRRPAARPAAELAQQLGQPPTAPAQPSPVRLAIRVVQRPRVHAGDPPVLRHHHRRPGWNGSGASGRSGALPLSLTLNGPSSMEEPASAFTASVIP